MKKGIYIFCCTCFIYCLSIKQGILCKANSVIHQTSQIIQKEEQIVKVLDEFTYVSMSHTYFDQYQLIVEGMTEAYVANEESVYGIIYGTTNSVLYQINLKSKEKREKVISARLYDITYFDGRVVVVGEESEDACIYVYQTDLQLVQKVCLGGEALERWVHIEQKEDMLFLFGEKKAYSKGSPFSHVGNMDDMKSFIVQLDKGFQIVNSFYINEQTGFEIFFDIAFGEEELAFILQDEKNQYHLYRLDMELQKIEKYNLSEQFSFQHIKVVSVKSHPESFIFIYTFHHKLYYGVWRDQKWNHYEIAPCSGLDYATIERGKLHIFSKLFSSCEHFEVTEYHILKQEDYIYNRYNQNPKDTSHIQIASDFEELTINYSEQNDTVISLARSGTYQAIYEVKREDGSYFEMITPYIVPQYINIVNLGIYKIGYPLLFTDELIVDGQTVYNGEKLKTLGLHTLIHQTKEATATYTIYITNQDVPHLENRLHQIDMYLMPDTSMNYQITLSENERVREVIVNQSAYPFEQDGTNIWVSLPATTPGQVMTYDISKMILEDGKIIPIHKVWNIYTLKRLPHIEIEALEQNIHYQATDLDGAILDCIIEYYQDDYLQSTLYTHFQSQTIALSKRLTHLKIYLLCDDGQHIQKISCMEFKVSSRSKTPIQLVFSTEKDTFQCLSIQGLCNEKLEVQMVQIGEKDMTMSFQFKKKNLIQYISIILSIVIIVIMICYRWYKKRKQRKI
ncbi:MAG: hypothetical protein NC182_06280 [Prevotella sp.]|nr:hypothetical protein [Staphylococcus sp.]MCM1350792.1 hypothetical protein [Prevotella sp.]